MPQSLTPFYDSLRLVSINFSFLAERSIRTGRSPIKMSSVDMVDYVVVGLYVVRFNCGAAEYFRGGSRVPWLVAGLSCFTSGFRASPEHSRGRGERML